MNKFKYSLAFAIMMALFIIIALLYLTKSVLIGLIAEIIFWIGYFIFVSIEYKKQDG